MKKENTRLENRRTFLIKSSMTALAMQIPFTTIPSKIAYGAPDKSKPEKAAVIWYSQTGNTEKVGKMIAGTLKKKGIDTVSSEYRNFDKASLGKYDLIIAGSPVYYYDVPSNFKSWLRSAPKINGASTASFVTFGGEGGNQHNTSRTLASLLVEKGGTPFGASEFGMMSAFAITWSTGNSKRILKYKHRPDINTYNAIRQYTSTILERINLGTPFEIDKKFDFREMIKNTPSIWGTKLFITSHKINKQKCIECGTCLEKCPVNAIDIEKGSVDDKSCIACLGCINNCPAQAIHMEFMGKDIYGFNDFLKRNNITVAEPDQFLEDA